MVKLSPKYGILWRTIKISISKRQVCDHHPSDNSSEGYAPTTNPTSFPVLILQKLNFQIKWSTLVCSVHSIILNGQMTQYTALQLPDNNQDEDERRKEDDDYVQYSHS